MNRPIRGRYRSAKPVDLVLVGIYFPLGTSRTLSTVYRCVHPGELACSPECNPGDLSHVWASVVDGSSAP